MSPLYVCPDCTGSGECRLCAGRGAVEKEVVLSDVDGATCPDCGGGKFIDAEIIGSRTQWRAGNVVPMCVRCGKYQARA